jgi:hypothetical protein
MEERDFFDEKQEKKPASLNCPHCHQSAEYEVTWIVRTKKRQLGGRADERDRARFAKFRSYMVRKDDVMACKNIRCRKRFDISGQSSPSNCLGGSRGFDGVQEFPRIFPPTRFSGTASYDNLRAAANVLRRHPRNALYFLLSVRVIYTYQFRRGCWRPRARSHCLENSGLHEAGAAKRCTAQA